MKTRISSAVVGIMIVLSALATEAQESDGPRDARALLEQAIAAMGGKVPQTSRIVGTVEISSGGETRRGTITCLTRALRETREVVEAGGATEDVTYAFGHASTAEGADSKRLSLNLALSSDSLCFPLAVLSRALANPEVQFELLGDETIEHRVSHHVRLSNVSDGGRASLGSSSSRDIWIDSKTLLPSQVKLDRRAAQGSEPSIPMVVRYSDYRLIGSWLVPYSVDKDYNGTPWTSIRVTAVEMDLPLNADAFRVE